MAIESKMKSPFGSKRPFSPFKKEGKRSSLKALWWIIGIVVVVAIVYGLSQWMGGGSGDVFGGENQVKGTHQAVFLDNGQVYFGKLASKRGDFWKLENVYYLEFQNAQGLNGSNNSDFTLIKLGNEAHGPEDSMSINTEHILFVEDMKSDSKVMKAISDHMSRN